MGLLVTVRESWAEFLRHDVASGANAYFTAAAPVIPIFTEKLRTLEQAITDGLKKAGLNVLIATVTAKDAQNQISGLYFNNIIAVARVFENPKVNPTGIAASDCAEAIAWFTRKFSVFGTPMQFLDIALGHDPRALCYDVLYRLEAGTTEAPRR